jgi:biotin carboxylase
MGEAVRAAGVRAVKQKFCETEPEVINFLTALKVHMDSFNIPFKCVVKPVQSAGSDDVFLCDSIEEARTAYRRIFGRKNGLGLMNTGALVQEFLHGKEYVIDKVSRDGDHRLVAVWQYDKRPVNGSAFVYFGMKLVDPNIPFVQEMISYANDVLDALNIQQGPSHMEVIYCADGPCLVEVGSRCHGGEGTWLPVAQECVGYTQVSVTLDCYLENKLFQRLNPTAFVLKKAGRDVDMVNRHSGVVRAYTGEAALKAMRSYRRCHSHEHENRTFLHT